MSKELRDRAEKALGEAYADLRDISVGDLPKLIHELRVHQVELELQNEELCKTQNALALSRDKYVELYDFAPIGYFTLDMQGLIVEANLAGARLLGLERALLIRKRFSRFIAPDFQDQYYFHQKQALASGDKQVCELLLLPAEGVGFYAQLQTVAAGDEQSIDRLRIAVIDITARVRFEEELKATNEELAQRVALRTSELSNMNLKLQEEIERRIRLEQVLRESEAKYRLVVEIANEGIVVAQDDKICFANSSFEKISGYVQAELMDMPMAHLFHPDDALMLLEQHWQSFVGKEEALPFTARIIDKAGKTRWLRNKRVLIEWNNRPAILGFLDDITARLHAEKALKKSEEELRNVILESPIGIAVYDFQGLMSSVNEAYLKIFGLDDGNQLKGTSLFNDPFLSKETKQKLGKGISIREEYPVDLDKASALKLYETTRSGSIYLDVLITPLGLSQSGSLSGYLLQIQDISTRKQAEESIHDLSQQLIKAHECERLMISRELHDRVGQDLSTLKMDFDRLSNESPVHHPETRKRIAAISALMQKTVTDIRDLAYELRPPGLDQFGFVQTISQHGKDFSEKTGLDVDMSFTGIQDLNLDFDTEINLYRLIQEGFNNIHKHARARRITLKMVSSFPNIILRIEDDGIGFDLAQRLASATVEKRMGLRSMQERTTLIGGTMRIRSQPGKGTKILIEIPNTRKQHGSEKNSVDRR